MKTSRLFFLVVLLIIQAVVTVAPAQNNPKKGDIISGIVCDDEGPLWCVNVMERDSWGRTVSLCATDTAGKFSFCLVNPENRIKITYVGYEKVDIPIDRTFFEIKLKEMHYLPVIDIFVDPGYEKKGLPIPVREYKRRMGVIGPEEPWTFEDLQKSAPDGYVCGYEIRIPQFGHSYGIFLVKEGKQYSLVYNRLDYIETRSIKPRQAKKLIASVESKIAYADNTDSSVNNENNNGVDYFSETIYEGIFAYAVTPDKVAYFWTDGSDDVPDETWREFMPLIPELRFPE